MALGPRPSQKSGQPCLVTAVAATWEAAAGEAAAPNVTAVIHAREILIGVDGTHRAAAEARSGEIVRAVLLPGLEISVAVLVLQHPATRLGKFPLGKATIPVLVAGAHLAAVSPALHTLE